MYTCHKVIKVEVQLWVHLDHYFGIAHKKTHRGTKHSDYLYRYLRTCMWVPVARVCVHVPGTCIPYPWARYTSNYISNYISNSSIHSCILEVLGTVPTTRD